jgi:hypothetical protein
MVNMVLMKKSGAPLDYLLMTICAHEKWPNDPSSATRTAGRHEGNSNAMAGFAEEHG